MRHPRWFREDRVERIGTALFSRDPTNGNPGVDVAVIELKEQPVPKDYLHAYPEAKLADAPEVPELSEVIVRGGRSGIRRGWILGPMMSIRSIKGRIWSNCWTIMEYDGGLVQEGDSGGPVILEQSNEVLGHVVAALGVKRDGGRRQAGLVQDMRTIVDALETGYDRPITVIYT
jgi:hypothetical protein